MYALSNFVDWTYRHNERGVGHIKAIEQNSEGAGYATYISFYLCQSFIRK